ncbi:MAG: MobC family plasmid mobilization relaxosome protein [Lachnospiraceae bacterium]|nr:MobC family plasmid mobilization relaxosome protein [Lachnospiraceae bacterium]
MARPKKEKPLQHDHPVMVRYSDIEYELIKEYAEQAGYPVAVYVRKYSLKEKPNITYNVVADISEIQKLATEYGKIGNNLNQIARYFHMGGLRSKAMQEEINGCITELHELRKETMKLVGDYRGNLETHRK